PWCDAPIRDYDHITPYGDGGHTSIDNGQGLCKRCNLTKEAPGWTTTPFPAPPMHPALPGATVTTPTGHTYQGTRPKLPGS
uniref:HNH endonuclease n=1 Tax=Specibacter cremeus TaxID=1629051 RepID=UPI0013DE22C2